MHARQRLSAKLEQKPVLTPSIRQALQLLQMPHQALIQHLHTSIVANPALAMDLDDEGEQGRNTFENSCTRHNDIAQWLVDPDHESLKTHLTEQLSGAGLCVQSHAMASLIIEALDERGLLAMDDGELTAAIRDRLADDSIAKSTVVAMRGLIKTFEPLGSGSQSPLECLVHQLDVAHTGHPNRALAVKLLTQHLSDASGCSHQHLSAKLQVNSNSLRQALALIQTLHPYPGHRFATGLAGSATPEAFVARTRPEETQSAWRVQLNMHQRPILKKSALYQDRALVACQEAQKFWQHCQHEANHLIKATRLRDRTLHRIIDFIANQQTDFLLGQTSHPKPLTQQTVASALGLSVSTVSRANSHKYLQSPRGVVALNKLFERHVDPTRESTLGQGAVLACIQSLVGGEEPEAALSDATIATQLNGFGVKIKRRTVTKYRQRLGIPSSSHRRRLSLSQWQGV